MHFVVLHSSIGKLQTAESFLLEDITDKIVSHSELKSPVLLCQDGCAFTHFSDEKAFSVHVAHRTALPVTHSFADPATP